MDEFDVILNKYGGQKVSPVGDEFDKILQKYGKPAGPVDEFDSILQKYSRPPVATQQVSSPSEDVQGLGDLSKLVYSEDNLVEDKFYKPILGYMTDRFGVHMKDLDRRDLIEKYTNNMRGFAGGNSVRAIDEFSFLNDVGDKEDKMARAGQAYAIYEGMQGLFGETTVAEKAEVVQDFVRTAVADPINLVGFGLGKIFTSTGFKGGSQIALIAAKKAYQKKIAQGATKEVAQKVGERVFRAQASAAATKTAQTIAKREAIKQGATTTLQKMTTSQALKEAAVVGGFEAAVGVATDYLYQDALIRTKVQDEFSYVQSGLAALGGIIAGGVALGSNALTGRQIAAPTPISVKQTTKGAKINISDSIAQYIKALEQGSPDVPKAGKWLEDVRKGVELEDQDTEFFITMLLGNDKLGMKGLVHTLSEQGYVWKPRNADDKVSNWIGDIIKKADPQDAKAFLNQFSDLTGIKMAQGKELTIEAFGDTFKKKMSDSGRVLNASSQAARILGKNPNQVTIDDYVQFISNGTLPELTNNTSVAAQKIGNAFGRFIEKDIPDFQNNLIRLLVSNISTTAMNVTGYAAATTLNSLTDVTRGVLLGGKAAAFGLVNPKMAKEAGISIKDIGKNQIFKLRNTLDPNTTYDTFLRYSQARPEAMKPLTSVLPGGVEDLKKLAQGFDPETRLVTLRANQAVDVIQRVNLVQAQDMYTKSIEFTSQLDKFLRRPVKDGGFGMGWEDFFSQQNYQQLMRSERFLLSEAAAIDETLKATFAKSYKGKGVLGEVAGAIEDARNIPGIGLLIPFGRFFNNTMAFAADSTGILPVLSKFTGKYPNRSFTEIGARGMVSIALVGTLAQREMDYIDLGLSWSEEIDEETGMVVDEKYEFPYGAYKAAARLMAYHWKGEEIPKELVAQVSDQFIGQLTRQLGDVGAGVDGILTALVSEEGGDLGKIVGEKLGAIPSQFVSASTRFLDPVNQMVGLLREEDYAVPDRNQGYKNFNNAVRYMDQLIAVATGEDIAPEKQSAASGTGRSQATKFVSTTRGSRLTNTERVMNMVGKPNYMANLTSQSEVADNRYNEIFFDLVEEKAGFLYKRKAFREGDLETRQGLLKNLMKQAKEDTLAYIGGIGGTSEDRTLSKMIAISKYSKDKVRRTVADLGIDKDVEDMSYAELVTLENALKFREEFKGIK